MGSFFSSPGYEDSESGSGRDVVFNRKRPELGGPMEMEEYLSKLTNSTRTTKYTALTFLPLSFVGQFRRLANVFFLVQTIVMLLGWYTNLFDSPLDPWSMLGTLLFVLGVTMCIEARDDFYRHKQDKETNNKRCRTLVVGKTNGELPLNEKVKKWRDIAVGDLVIVEDKQAIPADLLLLTSSKPEGTATVETSNIDGETNLKVREPPRGLAEILRGDDADSPQDLQSIDVAKLSGFAFVGHPNPGINSFSGKLSVETDNGLKELPLNIDQLLLRGATLQNTRFVIGLAIYTGEESKVSLNKHETPSKMSSVETLINKSLWSVVAGLLVLATVCAALASNFKEEAGITDDPGRFWYVFPEGTTATFVFPTWLADWLAFFILFNNAVPINLYVSMEICHLFQSLFISFDPAMKYGKTWANARTSNLGHELGLIDYIFSDKTGTLTQNVMEAKFVCAGGEIVDIGVDNAASSRSQAVWKNNHAMEMVLTIMSVAHTTMIENEPKEDGTPNYQAESPDETALVEAAARVGFMFIKRSSHEVTIQRPDGDTISYKILAINQFNSSRKRMSVIVKDPAGQYKLFLKGADNVVLERKSKAIELNTINLSLHDFSSQGLRTLAYAHKDLTIGEAEDWLKRHEEASLAIEDRSGKLEAIAEEIENDLELVGASAIEDKLQDGVPDAIADLVRADIKLWVLTGDKLETAINIGHSCKLLQDDMDINVLAIDPKRIDHEHASSSVLYQEALQQLSDLEQKVNIDPAYAAQLTETGGLAGAARRVVSMGSNVAGQRVSTAAAAASAISSQNYRKSLHATRNGGGGGRDGGDLTVKVDGEVAENPDQRRALVLTGEILALLFSDTNAKARLREVAQKCNAVLACRVSPLQKAEVVKMMRYSDEVPVTLAIGDGANDVSMIQAAHVGVGINGREGLQAANSADFSIAQFRFLKRLLLIHGAWNQARMGKVVSYTFMKNFCIATVIFYYILLNAFSGTSVIEEWHYTGFNFFTSFVIIGIGVLDQHVSVKSAMEYPELYKQDSPGVTVAIMVKTILRALLYSVIVAGWPLLAVKGLELVDFGDLFSVGLIVFTGLIFATQARAIFVATSYTVITWVLLGFSFALFFSFMFLYALLIGFANGWSMYLLIYELMATPMYWFLVIAVTLTASYTDFMFQYLRREVFPNKFDLAAEIDHNVSSLGQPSSGVVPAASSSYNNGNGNGNGDGDSGNEVHDEETGSAPHHASGEEGTEVSVKVADNSDQPNDDVPSDPTYLERFLLQQLSTIRVLITPKVTMTAFFTMSLVFLIVGTSILASGANAHYVETVYDGNPDEHDMANHCPAPSYGYNETVEHNYAFNSPNLCTVSVTLDRDMKAPITVRYGLTNFFQNHLRYVQNLNALELRGEEVSQSALRASCTYASGFERPTNTPCGFRATSLFTDTFQSEDGLSINETGIDFGAIDEEKYGNPSDYPNNCDDSDATCLFEAFPNTVSKEEGVLNEHFHVWMQPAALPEFSKKWGYIEDVSPMASADNPDTLSKGTVLNFTVSSNFPVREFDGSKSLILSSQESWVGERNSIIGVLCMVMFAISLISGLAVFAKEHFKPRKPMVPGL